METGILWYYAQGTVGCLDREVFEQIAGIFAGIHVPLVEMPCRGSERRNGEALNESLGSVPK